MMRSSRVLIGVLLALCLVGGAAYLGRARLLAPAASSSERSSISAAETADDTLSPRNAAATAENAERRARFASTPLPPLDAPLRSIVRDLATRAEAGDARAMCRLAAEYRYCDDLQTRMQMIENGVARVQARTGQDGERGMRGMRSAERMGAAFDEASERFQHCEGVTLPPPTTVARYLRDAAAAGHVQATGYYVSGDIFRNRDTLENLTELSFYRDNAEALARTAVAGGDLRAAWTLADAYAADPADRRRSLLAQAVKPAPDKALALLYGLRAAAAGGGDDPAVASIATRLQERIASIEQKIPAAELANVRSQPSGIGATASDARGLQTLASTMFSRGGSEFQREICE